MNARNTHEFLARNAQSSFQIYEEVMHDELDKSHVGKREEVERLPHKIKMHDAIWQKLAERSARAIKTTKAK